MARGLTDAEMTAMEASPGAPANPVGAIGTLPGVTPPKGLTDEEMAKMEADPSKGDLSTPSNEVVKYGLQAGKTGLSYAAKLADMLRGGITAPIAGSAIEAVSGKKVYSGKDWLNALNPTTTEKFPSTNEMLERAGVPEGAKLSDVMPGYAAPNGHNPWYQPEKGGMLDPSIRGTGGFAADALIDPLTYLTGGAASAERAAAEQTATRSALAGRDVLNMGEKVAKPNLPGRIGMAPQKAVGWLGDKFYSTPISPVLDQATKKGKQDLDKILYEAGLKTPGQTQTVVAGALDKLGASANDLLSTAETAGAKTKLETMLEPMKALREKMASIRSEATDEAVKTLDEKIGYYQDAAKGAPAIPDQFKGVPSPILDAYGKPIIKETRIPGTPEIPPTPYGPVEATGVKTTAGYKRNNLTATPLEQQTDNALAIGAQKAVEQSVGEKLGTDAEKSLHEINQARSGLISTKQGQATAQAQGNRLANRTFSPDGTSGVVAGIGAAEHGIEGGLKAVAAKKLMDLLRMGSMPAGYGMKKFGESTVAGPFFDVWAKGKLEENAGTPAGGNR